MRRIIIVLFLCSSFFFFVSAEDSVLEEQKEAYGLNEVADFAQIDRDTTLEDGIKTILTQSLKNIRKILTQGLTCVAVALAISALCGVFETLFLGQPPFVLSIASSLAIMGTVTGSVTGMIEIGKSAIEQINTFSKVLMPSLMTAGIASGTPIAATSQYSITMLFSDVLLTAMNGFFLPLVYTYLVLIAANAALSNQSLSKISSFLKWSINSSLKLVLMVFIGYITASGLISVTTDVVGVKTAQFAISGTVPVVGGILADAGETVIAGAIMIKNSIGVVGMLGVLSIVLTPFLTLGVNFCLFKVASALSEPMCDMKISGLLDQIGGGLGMVLSMLGSSAVLFFISIISGMFMIGIA